ncbi:LysR family transcriptional regulator [Vagococcus intermedius]|uniref:LysR family transcriptional regulator n=1 Tax=Vagococcus intermedius TaxID=2991418 RepID=A0AAF0I8I6_9ENTE|nr:LysR family transcriptional regulator [Vagococcus intermedius]WEG74189.1 LysR family transcriptional regulator [Vagococcus intermedius]WEG76270.1 LysR family transcriptional regulator [Vagococcus intermedius]
MKEHPNKLISSRAFAYFLQLAETLNYTKTAQLLGISQPALTQQIKKLESKVGASLFRTAGKQLSLTEAGIIMKEAVENIYDVLVEATEKIHDENSCTQGKITIGISASVEDCVLTSFITDYFKEYPNVEVTLFMVGRREVWEFLEKNKIDIAILYLPSGVLNKWSGYESIDIITDELLFLHHDAELELKESITYKESQEYPWVTYPKSYFVSEVIQSAFESIDMKKPESVAHFTKPEQMFRFSNETGVNTALPRSFFQAHKREGELRAIPFNPPITMDLTFVFRKEKMNVPRIAHFLNVFQDYVKDEDYISRLKNNNKKNIE